MLKPLARKLTLATTVVLTVATAAHATPPTLPPTPGSVTGTDPEPTSPHVVEAILIFLHLA
jgi:hypothetical protein